MNFMTASSRKTCVRSWHSSASARIEEMVGRVDRLEPKQADRALEGPGPRLQQHLCIKPTLAPKSVVSADASRTTASTSRSTTSRRFPRCSASPPSSGAKGHRRALPIRNVNRVVGTITGSEDHEEAAPRRADDTITHSGSPRAPPWPRLRRVRSRRARRSAIEA